MGEIEDDLSKTCYRMLSAKFFLAVCMVMHVMIFKSEILSNFNLEKFRISKINKFVLKIPEYTIVIIELLREYLYYMNDKLITDIFNPVKLLSSIMVFGDDSKEGGVRRRRGGHGLKYYWHLLKKNGWIILLMVVLLFWVILPALAIVLATGLLGIPVLIINLVFTYILVIFIGFVYFIFFRDNTSEIFNCAEGLDASGNLKDKKTMSTKEKIKMKLCKYWLNSIEPAIIIFSSFKREKDIKIFKIIKDATGKVIKVILPGNVIYNVKPLLAEWIDPLDGSIQDYINPGSTPDLKTIYIKPDNFDLLRNNMALFKDLENEIFKYKQVEDFGYKLKSENIFNMFMTDYKTNMMVYFGINNINMFFFYTFAMLFALFLTDTILNFSFLKNSITDNHIIVDSSRNVYQIIAIAILKIMTIATPLKHVIKNFVHLDLVKDKIFGSQAIFLLFEILIYSFTGFALLVSAVTNNTDVINCLGPASSNTWLIILWFFACAVKILLGDIIICEVDGTYDKRRICTKNIYTSLQRIQECAKLSKSIVTTVSPPPSSEGAAEMVVKAKAEAGERRQEFTNISNKKFINNLLGYSSIREIFTLEKRKKSGRKSKKSGRKRKKSKKSGRKRKKRKKSGRKRKKSKKSGRKRKKRKKNSRRKGRRKGKKSKNKKAKKGRRKGKKGKKGKNKKKKLKKTAKKLSEAVSKVAGLEAAYIKDDGPNAQIFKQMRKYNCDLKNKAISDNDQMKLFMENLINDLKEIWTKKPNKVTLMKFIKSVDWIIFISIPFFILVDVGGAKMPKVGFLPTWQGDILPDTENLLLYGKIIFGVVLAILVFVLIGVDAGSKKKGRQDKTAKEAVELTIMVMLPYVLLGICELLAIRIKAAATSG